MMFAVHCPRHDSTVLMTRRNAISFWNGPDGPMIRWKCRCGHEGVLTRHGSTPDALPAASSEASGEVAAVAIEVAAVATEATGGGETALPIAG